MKGFGDRGSLKVHLHPPVIIVASQSSTVTISYACDYNS